MIVSYNFNVIKFTIPRLALCVLKTIFFFYFVKKRSSLLQRRRCGRKLRSRTDWPRWHNNSNYLCYFLRAVQLGPASGVVGASWFSSEFGRTIGALAEKQLVYTATAQPWLHDPAPTPPHFFWGGAATACSLALNYLYTVTG
jgi:hypothetical protein